MDQFNEDFLSFLNASCSHFHAVQEAKTLLSKAGFKEVLEVDSWQLHPAGKYYFTRNGSTIIAFTVGGAYKQGQGFTVLVCVVLLHFTSLHFTSLHFTSLHFTSLYFTSLHFTSLPFPSLYFPSLHSTSLHSTSLHFTSLHSTSLQMYLYREHTLTLLAFGSSQ